MAYFSPLYQWFIKTHAKTCYPISSVVVTEALARAPVVRLAGGCVEGKAGRGVVVGVVELDTPPKGI